MNTLFFVALVSGTRQDGYRAQFPDVAGCEPEGQDLGELMINARRALASCLEAIAASGEAWPTPTPLEDLAVPPGGFAIPVDVAIDDPPIRVNISLGERLVQRLDAAAEARGMSRSGFIAQAVKVSLGERSPSAGDFEAASRRLQDEFSVLGRHINDSIGPDSAFSRRMAELDDKLIDGVRKVADSVSAAMNRRREAYRSSGAPAGDVDPASGEPRPNGGSVQPGV